MKKAFLLLAIGLTIFTSCKKDEIKPKSEIAPIQTENVYRYEVKGESNKFFISFLKDNNKMCNDTIVDSTFTYSLKSIKGGNATIQARNYGANSKEFTIKIYKNDIEVKTKKASNDIILTHTME